MSFRPINAGEKAALRTDKFERVYRMLGGRKAAEARQILEVDVPEDFDETEFTLFLDGVFHAVR